MTLIENCWPVIESFSIKKKENRNAGSNPDLELGPFTSLSLSLTTRLHYHTDRIHEDPGADSGGEGKSKRAEKYGTKKSKERQEEPLGTMSYQTSSKRLPPFWLLIGARKRLCFSAQAEGRTAATVWNWSGKTLSPGALLAVLYFRSCHIFPPV